MLKKEKRKKKKQFLGIFTYRFYTRPHRFHLHSPLCRYTQHPGGDKPHFHSATHLAHNLEVMKYADEEIILK